jgi:hypothetical protein
MVIYKIFVFGADRKSNMAARAHNVFWLVEIFKILVVSNKKIFKFSTNQNTLWALAAMLDFRSAPKTKILYKICESFADRKLKMATMTRLNFNIGPYGKNV